VERVVLEALSREELDLAVRATEKVAEQARELDEQWRKRIEAARYEAEKAARRYRQVEPENRLVARTLEADWNARLEYVQQLERAYEERKQKPPMMLTAEQREKIRALAEDLPRLWRAPTTTVAQRKRLLRLLVEDVTLRNSDDPWCLEVGIHWKSGAATRHQAERVALHAHGTKPEVVARIRELYRTKQDKEIADILNAEGYRTGYGKPFTVGRVSQVRWGQGLKKYDC